MRKVKYIAHSCSNFDILKIAMGVCQKLTDALNTCCEGL